MCYNWDCDDRYVYEYGANGQVAQLTNTDILTVTTSEHDAAGRPARITRGDVIGLIDSNGTKMVSYTYDAWGKPIGKTDTLASTLGAVQPFRYRGYVYDEDTELYYLRNRYYNPDNARFVNADALIAQIGCLHGNNLFAYAFNNPVDSDDN